jgi:uncharacterized protein (TIGR00266 family)
MEIAIDSRPSYGMAVVTLDKGDEIIAEAGAMAAMGGAISASPELSGAVPGDIISQIKALLFALARKFLAGETVFVNRFRAREPGQQLMIAPAWIGDVAHISLSGDKSIMVQAGSWLAATPKVRSELVWGGFSMLFGGEGAFFLKCRGEGELLLNAYGAIEKIEIDGKYIVDTGHVVAFEGNLQHSIRRAGGWKSTLLSGEGLVLEFKGQGTLWTQTRNVSSLVGWISPFFRR